MARDPYQFDDLGFSYSDQFTTMQQPSAPSDPWFGSGGFDQFAESADEPDRFEPMPTPDAPRSRDSGPVQQPTTNPDMTPSSLPLAQTPSGVEMLAGVRTMSGDVGGPQTSYDQTMQELEQATDPQQKAMLQDQLARTLYSDLAAAGHDVGWNGDRIVVDGREYEIGPGNFNDVGGQTSRVSDAPAPAGTSSVRPIGGTTIAGWTPNGQDWLPVYRDGSGQYFVNGDPTGTSDNWSAYAGDPNSLQRGTGEGGRPTYAPGQPPPQQTTVAPLPPVIAPGSRPGSSRTQTSSRTAQPSGFAAGPMPVAQTAQQAVERSGFRPTFSDAYVPDVPMDDIPNLSYEQLLGQDAIDKQLEAKLSELLSTPEGLSDIDVERLKARSKEEALGFADQADEELRRLEYEGGLEGSRWIDSERMRTREERDSGLIRSNRDIDIKAAEGRAADRRAAIALGQDFQNAKAQRRQLAADTVMRQSALRGDRIALRETAKQRAKELGISEQKVLADYTMGVLDDATRRYGIDIDALLAREGFEIDRQKLEQADAHFLADLGHRVSLLRENQRQYNYDYGLKVAESNAKHAPTGGA